MIGFLDEIKAIAQEINPSMIYIITNNAELAEEIINMFPRMTKVLATKSIDEYILEKWIKKDVIVKKTNFSMAESFAVLQETKDLFLEVCSQGLADFKDKILCIISTNIHALLYFDVKDIGIARLKDEVAGRVDIMVLENILNIAFEIAREGIEGAHLGALFVIGDTENVMKKSRQLIINPYVGHDEEKRTIMNRSNWATIKQFAQLDGATIVTEDGLVIASGRYFSPNWEVVLQSGLGGRHIAGASITKDTMAIAVVVSSSSRITIYKDGTEIYKFNAL